MAEYFPGTGPGFAGNFSMVVSRFAQNAPRRAELVVKRTMMDIFRHLLLVTPVDTGYCRSCWNAGMSVPDVNLARGGPGPFATKEGQAMSAIMSMRVGEGLVGYIYNNCRYIIPLEYGHSSQAPAPFGIVRKTLLNFGAILAKNAGAGG